MVSFHDYDVRVWGGGDVSLNSYMKVGYGRIGGAEGFQCNADPGTPEYEEALLAARDLCDAAARLDAALVRIGGGDADGRS